MTKKIKCQSGKADRKSVRVRVIKAPLVNTDELRTIVLARAKALVI